MQAAIKNIFAFGLLWIISCGMKLSEYFPTHYGDSNRHKQTNNTVGEYYPTTQVSKQHGGRKLLNRPGFELEVWLIIFSCEMYFFFYDIPI